MLSQLVVCLAGARYDRRVIPWHSFGWCMAHVRCCCFCINLHALLAMYFLLPATAAAGYSYPALHSIIVDCNVAILLLVVPAPPPWPFDHCWQQWPCRRARTSVPAVLAYAFLCQGFDRGFWFGGWIPTPLFVLTKLFESFDERLA